MIIIQHNCKSYTESTTRVSQPPTPRIVPGGYLIPYLVQWQYPEFTHFIPRTAPLFLSRISQPLTSYRTFIPQWYHSTNPSGYLTFATLVVYLPPSILMQYLYSVELSPYIVIPLLCPQVLSSHTFVPLCYLPTYTALFILVVSPHLSNPCLTFLTGGISRNNHPIPYLFPWWYLPTHLRHTVPLSPGSISPPTPGILYLCPLVVSRHPPPAYCTFVPGGISPPTHSVPYTSPWWYLATHPRHTVPLSPGGIPHNVK